MKFTKFIKSTVFVAAMLLAGCATPWVKVAQPTQIADSAKSIEFSAPQQWMQFNGYPSNGQNWRFTRDGFAVQEMVMSYDNSEAAIRYLTGQINGKVTLKLEDDMPPSEMAGALFAEIRKLQSELAIEMVEKAPINVAGHEGFKLVYRWKNNKGLTYQQEVRGVNKGKKLFLSAYTAVQRNFWARDYAIYEQLLASTKLTG